MVYLVPKSNPASYSRGRLKWIANTIMEQSHYVHKSFEECGKEREREMGCGYGESGALRAELGWVPKSHNIIYCISSLSTVQPGVKQLTEVLPVLLPHFHSQLGFEIVVWFSCVVVAGLAAATAAAVVRKQSSWRWWFVSRSSRILS